ncbi:MAG: hypothetical protein SFU85_01190 [Candidatus Methylacidiphilales bacterium]|nr:hypothetical protein [Candidatus Methylacidiphilales bacterium]
MSLEQWKTAYRQLEPSERKEFARWVLEQEMAGGVPVVDTYRVAAPAPAKSRGPIGRVVGVVLLAGLVAVAIWQGWAWNQRQAEARARMTASQREAEEAKKPRSPKNMEFLRGQLGREITVTGVPEWAEVGQLYFSRDRREGLRLNLMPGGVVLLQSAELEELVRNKVGVTVTGVVEKAADGVLEIRVESLGQLRRDK